MDIETSHMAGMPLPVTPPRGSDAELREAASALEASFLAEMLSHSGLGRSRESFGGGAGEDAFSSLLVREHAQLMTERGGIGLAESIFRALSARQGGGE